MAKLVVYYPQQDGATFDRTYYTQTHIPLVEQLWGPSGLTGADVLWPGDGAQPFAAMVVLSFENGAAIDAALASGGTANIMGDVAKFTNIQPGIYRAA